MAKVVYVVEEERSWFSFFVSMLLNKWVLLALLIWYVYRTITVKIRSANLTRAQANSMKWGLIGLVLFALADIFGVGAVCVDSYRTVPYRTVR